MIVTSAAGPAVAVHVNVTGEVTPAEVALILAVPGVGDSVTVTDAWPLLFATTLIALTVAEPDVRLKVTVTPGSATPAAVFIDTTSGLESVLFTVPDCKSPETIEILGAAAVAVAVNVTGASVPKEAVSVYVPAVPASVQAVCAWPLASVTAV
jgi:hypothetical protein